jgi:hypothetical protein
MEETKDRAKDNRSMKATICFGFHFDFGFSFTWFQFFLLCFFLIEPFFFFFCALYLFIIKLNKPIRRACRVL